ncbi:MAG: hypothetical protein C7B46_12920 [Sulfobacillus benefaciens]|uniref:Beta-ketoacyl synthase C-terminal domain-containing protein n=1 Tax=Sulfobacillus benefaciens TaxID=453960 RepID=A0A2T2XDV7_9FIRM|nr:MAG: hypothetical protein C7B46_12920 [Sulfobacillus benefaciens]
MGSHGHEASLNEAEQPPIDALIAHGTGTKMGDAAEIRAINDVFWRHNPALAVTSIKGHIGHSTAAAGVMAVIAGIQAISARTTASYYGNDERRSGGPI